MPSLIDIVIRGQDRSGPAFASAAGHLQRLTQGADRAQTEVRQLGVATSQSGAQAVTGLARIEQQASDTSGVLLTLGIAGSTTATRMRSLGVTISNQEERLVILGRKLQDVRAGHDADSIAVLRAEHAYNSLNRTLANNYARMQDLRASGDVTGISVVGVGGAAAGPAGLAGALGGLNNAAATLGFAVGAREVLQFGVNAGRAANDLEKTNATIRALSGTQERYSEVLALARRNQSLYGGSTQDTLESFRGLIPLANSANVALADLDNTVRKLSILSPEQGAQGAAIALREFLTASGAEGAESLQYRFEIQKRGLTDIISSTDDATERVRLLNEMLAAQGITSETVAAQANTTANTYDRLGAAADRAKVAVGGLLAEQAKPLAEGLIGLLNFASGDVSGGLEGLYRGGNLALGYRGDQLNQRMAAVGHGPATTVIQNTYNVQGSMVTERQITDTTRRNNAQTAARNGMRR